MLLNNYNHIMDRSIPSEAYDLFLSDIRKFISSARIYIDELRTLGWGIMR